MKETTKAKNDVFDLDTLLHPARAFAHPMDVVRDPDLTLNEKRAMSGFLGVRLLCRRSSSGVASDCSRQPSCVGRHHGCASCSR